jgi:hypothetical protein
MCPSRKVLFFANSLLREFNKSLLLLSFREPNAPGHNRNEQHGRNGKLPVGTGKIGTNH